MKKPSGSGPIVLVLERTQAVVAAAVEMALTRRTRRVGLLGRARFEPQAALVLAPCLTIHTAFMRFPIDVAFVARDGRVLRLIHALQPWRAAVSPRARAAIELPAGTLRLHRVEAGDRLVLAAGPEQPGQGDAAC